jgi:hypothetical protein
MLMEQVMPVPFAYRPPKGPNPVAFETAETLATAAFDECVSQAGEELLGLIERLTRVQASQHGDFAGQNLHELMARANDVRGVAQTLGSEIIADIAQAIFELGAAVSPEGSLPAALVRLFGQSALRLANQDSETERSVHEEEVRRLLKEARAYVMKFGTPAH